MGEKKPLAVLWHLAQKTPTRTCYYIFFYVVPFLAGAALGRLIDHAIDGRVDPMEIHLVVGLVAISLLMIQIELRKDDNKDR